MKCPHCGIDMNYHAEKIEYSETGPFDPDFGGMIEEAHSCPRCGRTEVRPEPIPKS
jgi:ribosomal protein S27AE